MAQRKARPVFGGLYNACVRRASWPPVARSTATQARKFFEDNFKPVRILPAVHTYGFYTGADGFYHRLLRSRSRRLAHADR